MISISLCMIVRDEEYILERCLKSVVTLVDEIIIVDTGSIDKTKLIARKYNAKIYDYKWKNNFSDARNYSFSKATKEFILWLDADDILIEKDINKLKILKENISTDIDVVIMNYIIETREDDTPSITIYRERLIKKERNYCWVEPIHEYIKYSGKVIYEDINITHKKNKLRTDRNKKIIESYLKKGEFKNPRLYYYYAKELHSLGNMEKSVVYYEKFLEQNIEQVSLYIDTCISLHKCYIKKQNYKKAIRILYQSFEYSLPRVEVCCMIGNYYKKKEIDKAIFWYELALKIKKPIKYGYIINDYYYFIPNIELSLCYFKKSDIARAFEYNEQALKYYPNNWGALRNRELIKNILLKNNLSV